MDKYLKQLLHAWAHVYGEIVFDVIPEVESKILETIENEIQAHIESKMTPRYADDSTKTVQYVCVSCGHQLATDIPLPWTPTDLELKIAWGESHHVNNEPKKVLAVMLFKERTGLSLKDAKEGIERGLMQKYGHCRNPNY